VVLTTFADEDNVAATLYLGDRAIAELDLTAKLRVEVGEEVLGTGHMVGNAHVQHPMAVVMLLWWSKVGEDLLLHDLHAPTW
jgi:hypothetical protein